MSLFYILDTRTVIGNEALWWRPERAGYTTNLDEAGQYNAEQIKGIRSSDVPVPVELARQLAHASVFTDRLSQKGYKKPKEPYRPNRCANCHLFVSRHVWLCRTCEQKHVYQYSSIDGDR